ncbi:MAG: phosphate ABC transporter substrate-binding protein [Thermodesulfovibrio sp. RBG_19FT_COMBO_42_12]|nr:MAG: phosphate ABC transporter substrate-binding protein [Thermodesulfovibrio sp. RBG_19FT_COMBO_42_12]
MKKLLTVFLSVLFLCSLIGFSYAENLRIDGSTTVLPIAQKTAEVFMKKYPDIKVYVSGSGSGTGIKALIDGTTDIATSSREAKDKEKSTAKKKGVSLTDHKVALDGIVPVVHLSMKINNITTEQLRDIYTGKIKSWKELGGPNRPISVVSRDTSSGTYEVWEEKILKGDRVRPDALLVASNGQTVQTVAQNKFAIGYIGIGYIDKTVKVLNVNGKKATAGSIRDGSWPVARPLFMYTNGKPSGVIAKFLDFMLSKEGQKVVNEVKYVSVK